MEKIEKDLDKEKADFQADSSRKRSQEEGTKESFSSFILIKSFILELQTLYKKGDPQLHNG